MNRKVLHELLLGKGWDVGKDAILAWKPSLEAVDC